ncbi:MAG: efflux RND transporter periplasmic adaptor subunit [Betaproteobacteria bacterium]|nr:efflux RND transporter periplasmic adaptor subunit [Betaproteobacteria bacterium]
MKRIFATVFSVVALAATLALGYWLGKQNAHTERPQAESPATAAAPRKDGAKRKLLYYRNPMGLPDTSPVPKKDQMGMDYIPVYEGEEPDASSTLLKVSVDKVQKLGVRTERVTMRELTRTIRAVGTIQVDERQIHTVAPKFEGWIERLHVNATGQYVARGQPLMEVYSPDLVTAQQEYLVALKGVEAVKDGSAEIQASMRQLTLSALQRLRNWDISDEELQRLQKEGAVRRTITLRSPLSGAVLEKPALKGMRFMPGEMLYQISNLSSLWLLADIFEQDLALIRPGQPAKITVSAYPDRVFNGRVAFIYPTLTPETRTAKARIELANPGGALKPAMYASVELLAGSSKGKTVAVPDSAVLDSGTRQIVLVQRDEGRFEPRPVKPGARADGYIEVLEGVQAGEVVVVSANFLIDSESNLKAALGSFGVGGQKSPARKGTANASGQTHKGDGTIRAVDLKAGSVTLEHGPIPTLRWPAMTMDFQVTDKALLKGMKPGQNVEFEFIPERPGEFVISRMAPAGKQATSSASGAAQDHKGH